MKRTNVDNQGLVLREKIKDFFVEIMPKNSYDPCPIRDMLAPSLDKWSLFVIFNLGYNDIMRFNDLKRRIDGISSRMLSTTLKKLESSDLIVRTVYAEVPPRVEYQLTELGAGFADKLIDMSDWFISAKGIKKKGPKV